MILLTFLGALLCWTLFYYTFKKDRSRYRNCYLLFFALFSLIPFFLSLAGEYMGSAFFVLVVVIAVNLLIVPEFLIYNGIQMIRREGRKLPQLLSLALGIVILLGEISFILAIFSYQSNGGPNIEQEHVQSPLFIIEVLIAVTVIYGSMSFLIFMTYVTFLQIIPRKRDFDYVIIHGAGLIDGSRVSKLLADRLDKAIEVYRKDPSPPKLIPSGGKGSDETMSEAEAMKNYLLEKGIPEYDILLEKESTTTYENLKYSKQLLDQLDGRKYTALVTSNYHVYRALRYCRKIGLTCTGIGSHVAFYYWPNALIREFIAIHAEKKHAVIFFGGWILCVVGILGIIL